MQLAAVIALAVIAPCASAAVAYESATFESVGYAWTDAGDEYAYTLSNCDEPEAPGRYTFAQSGSAPGYSASAGIGVVHDATLDAAGLHMRGEARTYVADDVGYAAVSATSEATATITFSLDKPTLVSLSGSLTLISDYPPTSLSNRVRLTGPDGTTLYTMAGVGPVSYQARLGAGTYTLITSASVADDLNAAGGDAYENNRAGYDVRVSTGAKLRSRGPAASEHESAQR